MNCKCKPVVVNCGATGSGVDGAPATKKIQFRTPTGIEEL